MESVALEKSNLASRANANTIPVTTGIAWPANPVLQNKTIVQKLPEEEQEPLQGKFIAQLKSAEEEELPLQGKFTVQKKGLEEEELPLQGKFISAVTVQEQQSTVQRFNPETPSIQKIANNTGLPDNLKEGVENLSGIALDDVNVHYNSDKPAQLNALAFAQGTDIHVGPGQEKHLPHEAWHVVQQKQGRVQPTMQMKGNAINDDKGLEREADVMGEKAFTQLKQLMVTNKIKETQCLFSAARDQPCQFKTTSPFLLTRRDIIQGAFQPALVNSKTHLRQNNAGNVVPGTKVGNPISSGTEIVVDFAQQDQSRKMLGTVYWDRAVNVSANNWNPAADLNAGGYVRASRVLHKAYPFSVNLNLASRGQLNLQKHWHENVGEYIIVENSIENPANRIVKVGNDFKSLNNLFQLNNLTVLEQTQVNDVSREDAAEKRLAVILTNAAVAGGINPGQLASPENIEKLKHPLRLDLADSNQEQINKWHTWSQAVYTKINSGATEFVASLNHWKTQLSPLNPAQCIITRIKLEGSDLHDKGLGAVFVDFTKPLGGIFSNQTNLTVVVKPEDRSIEKSLFGTQPTSLANQVNNLAGLNANDEISRIEMETHANYGSIIEFVQGQQARAINGTGGDTQAMSEGIAFAFLAGLSDVHQDNVIWHNGKPYFIDADNALNALRLTNPSSQSGFSMNNKNRTDTDMDHLNNNPALSRSAIVQALLLNSTPLINAVQAAFTNKIGRVVPLYTNFWANHFKNRGYITLADGNITDGIVAENGSRWYIANKSSIRIPRGGAEIGKGLVGEAGIAGTGEFYDRLADANLIKADLDQGKIPFYNYDYTSGDVSHNGLVIWHGQNIADAIAILLLKLGV